MIGKINGIVDDIGSDHAIITVVGIGLIVFVSKKTIHSLVLGESISIYIETIIRQESIQLYGFFTLIEKQCFEMLIGVQGVGPKVAIAVLSHFCVEEFITAISSQKNHELIKVDGIGPKVANRILLELKDKIKKISFPIAFNGESKMISSHFVSPECTIDNIKEDALKALLNLGFSKIKAQQAINYFSDEKEWDVATLIRHSLKYLGS
jgi:Holliday junction DNA helicase RuvA